MLNGRDINERLTFGEQTRGMGDRELIEFIGRTVYEHCEDSKWHPHIIRKLEQRVTLLSVAFIALVVVLSTLGIINTSFLGLVK